jgi:citrate synthase
VPTPAYLTAREAAERLGVKRETLYAYVARGLLRRKAGEKGRVYAARDVALLAAKHDASKSPERAARGALHFGTPVVESSIAFTDGLRLFYRGRDVAKLAVEATFEQVAELLWASAMPAKVAWSDETAIAARARALVTSLPPDVGAVAKLQAIVPWLAAHDDEKRERAVDAVCATARRMILRSVAALGGEGDSVAETLLVALGGEASAEASRAMDAALVLSAEHELNPSTFVARVAAGAGADPYAITASGLGALSGAKHGGSLDRFEAFVNAVGDTEAEIPDNGFGHPLYPDGDPRAPPLLELARAVTTKKTRAATDRVFAVLAAGEARGEGAPNLDVGLVAIATALGLAPRSASGIFAVGRMAGWIAHALEQWGSGAAIRPRARYVGVEPER